MSRKFQKTVSLNHLVLFEIEEYRDKNKIATFGEALNKLFIELLHKKDEIDKYTEISSKQDELKTELKDGLRAIATLLKKQQ